MTGQIREVSGTHGEKEHGLHVTTQIIGHNIESFSVSPEATLLELMKEGARLAGYSLLPAGDRPFDQLHGMHGQAVGPAIEHLDETVAEFLRHSGGEPHFAIELARALRVTKRWDVAPKDELSPREILSLPKIHLPYNEYTLYLPESNEPLPLDTPIKIERGADFEAQRDGRYGGL